MNKESEVLETSVLLKFLDDWLNRYDVVNIDYNFYKIKQALHRLEAIDNANPSEALKCLERIIEKTDCMNNTCVHLPKCLKDNKCRYNIDDLMCPDYEMANHIKQALLTTQKEHKGLDLLMQELDCKDFAELRKYARCGYEKLNKQYLKWEDLEFEEDGQETLVLLNGTKYRMYYYKGYDERITLFTEDESVIHMFEGGYPHDKQFFNDLHLERVEE